MERVQCPKCDNLRNINYGEAEVGELCAEQIEVITKCLCGKCGHSWKYIQYFYPQIGYNE